MPLENVAGLLIKPLAFAVTALPLAIDNLRTGRLTNIGNAVLFVTGLGVLALGERPSMLAFHVPAPSLWMLVALAPLVAYALGWVHGGAAKFLIALLPWFSSGQYLGVAGCGFIVSAIVAVARRRKDMQVAPAMVALGLAVQVLTAQAAWPR